MKLFHFHILLIQSFILYVLTCLLISQSALSDTLPDSSLRPSCSSPASEAGAEAGLPPENIRTFLRSATDNLPANHALRQDERYRRVIEVLREPADNAPPAGVSHFLDEMERRVEALNNQITVNDSNRLQLVQPRNAFTFPLTVIHALSDGVLDRDTFYITASNTFMVLQSLIPVRATETEEQKRARQQSISSMYEALFLYFLLTSSDQDASLFLVNTLEEYIDDIYRSHFSLLPPDYSILPAANRMRFVITGSLCRSTSANRTTTLIPDSMQLHHIDSLRPAAVLECTFNNVSYMTLLSFSQPPVTVTTSSDQSETFLRNVRDVHNASPEVDQLRFEMNALEFLEAISSVFSGTIANVIAVMGLVVTYFASKRNTGK